MLWEIWRCLPNHSRVSLLLPCSKIFPPCVRFALPTSYSDGFGTKVGILIHVLDHVSQTSFDSKRMRPCMASYFSKHSQKFMTGLVRSFETLGRGPAVFHAGGVPMHSSQRARPMRATKFASLCFVCLEMLVKENRSSVIPGISCGVQMAVSHLLP